MSESARLEIESLLGPLLYPADYGLRLVRLGAPHDGGYVLPADVRLDLGIGIGIDRDWTFERAVESRLGVPIATVDLEAPDLEHPRHISKFIGPTTIGHFISPDDLLEQAARILGFHAAGASWLVKMDVEGYEYLTLPLLSDAKWRSISIIVLELHALDLITNEFSRRIMLQPLLSRLVSDYSCVFCHPCWEGDKRRWRMGRGEPELPSTVEVTFVRKDLLPARRGLLSRDITQYGGAPQRANWRLRMLPDCRAVFPEFSRRVLTDSG